MQKYEVDSTSNMKRINEQYFWFKHLKEKNRAKNLVEYSEVVS
jgi:hypothetical protein